MVQHYDRAAAPNTRDRWSRVKFDKKLRREATGGKLVSTFPETRWD